LTVTDNGTTHGHSIKLLSITVKPNIIFLIVLSSSEIIYQFL